MSPFPAAEPAPPPAPYRVSAKRRETHDTWTLTLEPRSDAVGEFEPGQFAMLYAFGAGEVPISVSARHPLRHTIRAVGATTAALCGVEEGDEVGVRGPFGRGWPVGEARGRDVIVAAGGIGLAPLRPVIHELMENREDYGRVSILYGGRSPGELLYLDEMRRWPAEVTVDTADAGWYGRVGLVTKLVARASFDPAGAVAMMCGPELMMRFTALALRDRGLPADAIWLSLERSMKCATGHCGHCQLGPLFVCRDGPVARLSDVQPFLEVREL